MAKIKQLKFFSKPNSFKIVKEELNSLLTNRLLKRVVQLAFLFLGLTFLILAFLWLKLPPQLPLFYSRPWGEEQLVEKNGFLILPISCLVFVLINLRIASIYFKKEFLLSQILVWSSFIIVALTTINIFKILLIVL